MEIEVGIETLDGSNGKSNGFLRITSSSLGASLVDHLSTIRFHAILCLLFFFSFPPPSSLHPSRISTGLWLAVVSRREIIVCGGGWSFERGEGEGLAHLHGGLVRSRATFSIVSVGRGDASFRDSWILPSKRRWMNERIGREFIRGLSSSFYIHFFIHIYLWIFSRVAWN